MPAITEPTTMLTDYVLAIAGWFFALRLPRKRGVNLRTSTLWAIGFVSLGFAGLVGGTFHGFRPYFTPQTLKTIWSSIILLIEIACGFMIGGVLVSLPSRYDLSTKWLLAGVAVTLVGLAIQQSTLALGPQFNHNDIFHCLQIVAMWCLFLGARLLHDRRPG